MLEWMITYKSSQRFELEDEGDRQGAIEDFSEFDIEIDSELEDPPFETKISNKTVIDLVIDGVKVTRTISCQIHLQVTDEDEFRSLMDEEMWYDEDDNTYNIINAINYWICDTCIAPDCAEFVSESCDYDVVKMKA